MIERLKLENEMERPKKKRFQGKENIETKVSKKRKAEGSIKNISHEKRDINATINDIISPPNLTVALSNSTEPKIEARQRGNPSAWEYSQGRRLPPCPGWPAKQRYNATHSVEWDLFRGTYYEPLNPKCPVSNGSA